MENMIYRYMNPSACVYTEGEELNVESVSC